MIPTPDLVLDIVARSIDQGRRAGLVSMLGGHAGPPRRASSGQPKRG